MFNLSDPEIAVVMLGLFILSILLGFPICFTLMAMGVFFGYYAYYDPERMQSILDDFVPFLIEAGSISAADAEEISIDDLYTNEFIDTSISMD